MLVDKEAWLPTVEELFKVQEATPSDTFVVEEFWSMDCPNHGQSAVLNDSRLHEMPHGFSRRPSLPIFTTFLLILCAAAPQWARAAHKLLTSGLISPGATLVALGHSAGACVM